MANLTYVKLFFDQLEALQPLTDEETGRLLRALWQYAANKETPTLVGNERFLWPMLKNAQDRAEAAYADMLQKASEAGKRGGRPSKKDGFSGKGTFLEKGDGFSGKGKNPIEEESEEESEEERRRVEVVVNGDDDATAHSITKNDLEYYGFASSKKDVDKARDLSQRYTVAWVREAMERASLQTAEARTWAYVEKILSNWETLGYVDPRGKKNALAYRHKSSAGIDAPSAYPRLTEEQLNKKRREEARTLARLRGERPD